MPEKKKLWNERAKTHARGSLLQPRRVNSFGKRFSRREGKHGARSLQQANRDRTLQEAGEWVKLRPPKGSASLERSGARYKSCETDETQNFG